MVVYYLCKKYNRFGIKRVNLKVSKLESKINTACKLQYPLK